MSNDQITASQPEQKCKRAHRKWGREKNYSCISCASWMFEVGLEEEREREMYDIKN